MVKRLLILAVAACAVTFNIPAASAAAVAAGCGVDVVEQQTSTSGGWAFPAYGYVVSDAAEAVTVRCELRLDGTLVSATGTGAGTGVAVIRGWLDYDPTGAQRIDLCAVYTVDGGPEASVCHDLTPTQVPPQDVIDLLDQVFRIVNEIVVPLDILICTVVTALDLQGTVNPIYPRTGLFVDHADCDISLHGERLNDFFPYGDPYGP